MNWWMARIRVLRRHLIREERSRMGAEVSVRGLKINFDAKEVTLDGNLLHVTPLEYQLLELLFHMPRQRCRASVRA